MKKKIYLVLIGAFAGSVLLVVLFHYFPVGMVGDLAGVPAIAALFGGLFQLYRDDVSYQRSQALDEAKNRFTIGATSHMANVAFDKHVLFCEEYVQEMFTSLLTLLEHGPTKDITSKAHALLDIRRKWAVWLTPKLEAELQPYENALFNIGIHQSILLHDPEIDDRQSRTEESFRLFMEIVGEKEWKGKPLAGELATVKIINNLRKILQIDELTQLRSDLIEGAKTLKR